MSRDSKRDFLLFSNALRHYSERLTRIQEKDEIKNGNETLKKDLDENAKKSLEIAQNLDESKTENISYGDITMIKSALALYKVDLIESSKSLKKMLFDVEIPLRNVGEEIKLIDSNLDHRNWYE